METVTYVRVMFSGIMNFAPNRDKTKWGVYVPDLTAESDPHMIHQALLVVEKKKAATSIAPDAEDADFLTYRLDGEMTFGSPEGQVRPTWHLLNDYLLKVENSKGRWDTGDCSTFDKSKIKDRALYAQLDSGLLEACWIDDYLWKWKGGNPQYLAEEVCLLFPIETPQFDLTFGKGSIRLSPGDNGEIEIRIVNIPGGHSKFNQSREDPEEDRHAMLYYRWAIREVKESRRRPLTGSQEEKPNVNNHEHRIGGLTKFPIPSIAPRAENPPKAQAVGGANCPPGGWGSGGP